MRFTIAITILATLVGCATPCGDDPTRIYTDDGHALYWPFLPIPVHCESIDCSQAVAFWGPEFVSVGEQDANLIAYCDIPPERAGLTYLYHTDLGQIFFGQICISPRYEGHWAEQAIIAHEIGHLLGLAEDTDGCPSIMANAANRQLQDKTITPMDREELLYGPL